MLSHHRVECSIRRRGEALDRDLCALAALVDWQSGECVTNWTGGAPSPPACQPGEAAGTVVDYVPLSAAETQHIHRAEFSQRFQHLFDEPRALCSVRPMDEGGVVLTFRLRRGVNVDQLSLTVFAGRITAFRQILEFPGEFNACTAS